MEFVDSYALPTARTGDGYGIEGENDYPFRLGRFEPGTLGGISTMRTSGCTPGDLVGFLLATSTGASSLTGSFCPNAIPLGIANPVLLGVDNASALGDASVTSFVPRVLRGWTLHYQAVDVGGCASSNVISQTF